MLFSWGDNLLVKVFVVIFNDLNFIFRKNMVERGYFGKWFFIFFVLWYEVLNYINE